MDIETALKILAIPPKLRTTHEIASLERATKEVKFFKELTNDMQDNHIHLQCCAVLTNKEYKENQCIFKFGDVGDCFCILLKGQVKVLIPAPIKPKIVDDKINVETANTQQTETDANEDEIQNNQEEVDQNDEWMLPGFIEVARLPQGASFGEMALLNDKPRNATIQCSENSIVALLQKKDYLSILSGYQSKQLNDKINFLRGLPAFSQ